MVEERECDSPTPDFCGDFCSDDNLRIKYCPGRNKGFYGKITLKYCFLSYHILTRRRKFTLLFTRD